MPETLPSAADAAALDREAASWPELALGPADASDLELRMLLPDLELAPVELPLADPGAIGGPLALRDAEGVLLAVLDEPTGTTGADGTQRVRGTLRPVRLPAHPDAAAQRHTPASLRQETDRRGWREVAALLTDAPLFAADLDRLRGRLEAGADGVVVALLAGGVEPIDPEHHARLAALQAGLETLPAGRVLLTVLPLSPAAPSDLRRAVAAGFGLDGAVDVGPAPGSPDAAEVREQLERRDPAQVTLEPAAVVDALRRTHPPRREQGLTVLFTGLSGSGKSTVAALLVVRLLERTARSVLLLDGDRVRRHLSKGLGFSREDRDANVRRIGWVAAQVSAAGGIAVCAPIAPYDRTRREVRAMVEDASPAAGFVLVHVATPLEECERRDRKGLYARARRGELPAFTGISDPYEEPGDAELRVDTTERSPADVVDEILEHLEREGWLAAPAT